MDVLSVRGDKMDSRWKEKCRDRFLDGGIFRGAPHILERGIWDCMGESIAQTHVRMHKAGVSINDIHGYRNLDLGGGPRE